MASLQMTRWHLTSGNSLFRQIKLDQMVFQKRLNKVHSCDLRMHCYLNTELHQPCGLPRYQ